MSSVVVVDRAEDHSDRLIVRSAAASLPLTPALSLHHGSANQSGENTHRNNVQLEMGVLRRRRPTGHEAPA